MQPVSGFGINKLLQEVHTRWLKPVEVLYMLQNHEQFEFTHKAPNKPPSGSLFFFNRRVLRYFRNDGYEWRRKKNGKTIAEGHERLKVNNTDALNCYYAHGEKNPIFQRRIYWMLDPAYDHIVLVHYREVVEGNTISTPALDLSNESSTSNQNASSSKVEVQSFPGQTSELNGPCHHSCSSGSVEEVSSQFLTINNGTHDLGIYSMIETCNQQALRKLEEQLSLDGDEDCNVNSELPPDGIENGLLFSNGIQNEELESFGLVGYHENNSAQQAFEDFFDGARYSNNGQIEEAGINSGSTAIEMLKNSDTWFEDYQMEAFLYPSVKAKENQWFSIREVSPQWAFSFEYTKVIITGDFSCNPSESSWAILFGDVKVPLEIIQQGVVRCQAPFHGVGKVNLCITDENGNPCSEMHEFEFRQKPSMALTEENSVKSSDELSLLLKLVQVLLGGHVGAPISKFECGFQADASETMKRTGDGSGRESAMMSYIIEELLKDKFRQWLSSKHQEKSEGDCSLPKQYHGVIHMISALGYDWALKPLLSSGVHVNYRDANGRTALHWAARFGREKMVADLLAAGASAGALSDPTSEDPAAKTPAAVASSYGYEGLSAFLSEVELTSHLYCLATKDQENSRVCAAGDEVTRAVDAISKKSAHLHGGTEDQLALKDSLEGVRNSVQAAARIQAVFRSYSFRKKQQVAARNRDTCGMSVYEMGKISSVTKSLGPYPGIQAATLEKAALSIQKNYRCWRRRKEFVTLRKYAIKIQAHVRAYQERKKYKEFLRTVGVLEKVIIRWFRKGVGLRGFQPEPGPIDREEEDDITKVFRKQRVEAALDQAVSRVSSIIHSPESRQQYRRMLETYRQTKNDQGWQQFSYAGSTALSVGKLENLENKANH